MEGPIRLKGLTSVVNFINVLSARFSFEILAPKITKLCFGFEVLLPKILYKKRACIMKLMKLTPGFCLLLSGQFVIKVGTSVL